MAVAVAQLAPAHIAPASLPLYERTIREGVLVERESFIRKAIGWALREYSYTEPDAVSGFLRRHGTALSGLSMREASKVLQRRDAT
jgi:3-methyladenine DNA glycosylase AlkD